MMLSQAIIFVHQTTRLLGDMLLGDMLDRGEAIATVYLDYLDSVPYKQLLTKLEVYDIKVLDQ